MRMLIMTILSVIVCVLFIGCVIAHLMRNMRHMLEQRLPDSITKCDTWRCVVLVLPQRRYWTVPNAVTENQAMDALEEIAHSYPGWIPAHRLKGKGVRSRWLLQLRKPSSKPILPSDLPVEENPVRRISIGLDLRHHPVMIRSDEHTLIIGNTGSGKGSLMATYMDGMKALHDDGLVQFRGIDLKGGVEMSMYGGLLECYAYTFDDAMALLQDLSNECAKRMEYMRGRYRDLAPSPEYPRIDLFIDEAGELFRQSDRKQVEQAKRLLDSVLSRGRALGIVVIALSQDPRVEAMPLRARFPQRIALRLNSESEAVMLLGKDAIERGATPWLISQERPGSGFVWNVDLDVVEYFRAPWYSDDDLRQMNA